MAAAPDIDVVSASVEEALEQHRNFDRGHEMILPERARPRSTLAEKPRRDCDRGHEMVLPERAR